MPSNPRALIIGDSISRGYVSRVRDVLAGRGEVSRCAGNAGDSTRVRENLDRYLGGGPFEVIHLNCGLHDVKVDKCSGEHQTPLEAYRANLAVIFERLARTGETRVIWATTTPVDDRRHARREGFAADRYQRDVERYNAVALDEARAAGLAVNDLHAVVDALGRDEAIGADGVHLVDCAYAALGDAVAAAIETQTRSCS